MKPVDPSECPEIAADDRTNVYKSEDIDGLYLLHTNGGWYQLDAAESLDIASLLIYALKRDGHASDAAALLKDAGFRVDRVYTDCGPYK